MEFLIGKINTSENLAAAIYALMKKNIMNWNLKPGTKMSESEIAEYFQVSRTPVRESFKQLVFEGLLETRPQRGSYVTRINLQQMREGHFVRESLERAVIPLLIGTQAIIPYVEKLQQNIDQQRSCLRKEAFDDFFALDEVFHNTFFEACGQNYAKQIANKANLDYLRVRIICMKSVSNPMVLCDQHQQLLEAIVNGDRQKADAVLTKHLNKVQGDLEIVRKQFHHSFFQPEL